MATVLVSPRLLDDNRCEYGVDRSIHVGEPQRFTDPNRRDLPPLAFALLSVPGVAEVEVRPNAFVVTKHPDVTWPSLEEPVRYAIVTALEQPVPTPVSPDDAGMDDDAMYSVVAAIFSREINPAVARHGGRVELLDVQDATVILRMQGGCQGCGMANVTLRQGIEGTLRRAIPGLRAIQDITDHSAGTDPYFSAEKK
jgi:NFU1 iron-sulfur cluster scaffold homolog, mitochondrial